MVAWWHHDSSLPRKTQFWDTPDWPSQRTKPETPANRPTREESSEKIRTYLEQLSTHILLSLKKYISIYLFSNFSIFRSYTIAIKISADELNAISSVLKWNVNHRHVLLTPQPKKLNYQKLKKILLMNLIVSVQWGQFNHKTVTSHFTNGVTQTIKNFVRWMKCEWLWTKKAI